MEDSGGREPADGEAAGGPKGARCAGQGEAARETMKTTFSQGQRRSKGLGAAVAVLCLGLASAPGQLAITEVMSWPAVTRDRTNATQQQSDWWELTNFGTDSTNLSGWSWADNSRIPDQTPTNAFKGLVIGPGQSAIIFRARETPTVEKFREWWGGCLDPHVAVSRWFTPGVGLNNTSTGDEIWLFDSQSNLVDQVSFGAARQGVTFTYDTNTGEFGVYSILDQCGTCRADTADDIGSPGAHCGPVSLRILEQPVSVEVNAGLDATFSVLAVGLPRPKYQWLFEGEPIPGATFSRYTVEETDTNHAGLYEVVVSNGLKQLGSTPAVLTVVITNTPPVLCSPLEDVDRFEGETALFTPCIRAYPRARYQWRSNGVDIALATNRVLTLPGVTLAASGGRYEVNAWNVDGSTNCSARLWVDPKPKLEITEAFPAASLNTNYTGPRGNWWELTNLGTNAVRLKGLRHWDGDSFYAARVVTNQALLQPGESVIFMDSATREDFLRWWGETNLPPRLQVIPYGGYGLNEWSDFIYVWSAAGTRLAGLSYASGTPYPLLPPTIFCDPGCETSLCDQPVYGHSLWFNSTNVCAWAGQGSEENVDGAFRAAASDDVGSPGFFMLPRFFGFDQSGSTVTLKWRAAKGKRYQVQWRPSVDAGVWTTDGIIHTAQGSTVTATDSPPAGTVQRFYRVREVRVD